MLAGTASHPKLETEEFITIRDFIYEKSGIWFAENKMYLIENRLTRRMSELSIDSFRDYFFRVKYDSGNKEFDILMNLITTNETSFFRNPPQLKTFQEEILPQVIKNIGNNNNGNKRIRIWSAGCSTGEEPYTLAIIIMEVLKSLAGWNIDIVANDISQQVLYTARSGVYQQNTFRTTDPYILQKYFKQEEKYYSIRDDVKRLVRFNHINLNDPRQTNMITDCDFVFCRNVMIYFSEEIKKSLVKQFYKSLRPGGFLFIGHSESLHGISKAFKLEYYKNALVYKKSETSESDSRKSSGDSGGSGKNTQETLDKIKELLNRSKKI